MCTTSPASSAGGTTVSKPVSVLLRLYILNVFVCVFVMVKFSRGISHTLVTYVYVCPYFRRIPISVDGSPYLLPRVEGTDRGQ